MKRFLVFSLALIIAFSSFTACEKKTKSSGKVKKEVKEEVEEEVEEETTSKTKETAEPTATPTPEIIYIDKYDEDEAPVKVYWDNVSTNQFESNDSVFTRLSDDYIYTYEPGTADKYIYPFVTNQFGYINQEYGYVVDMSYRYGLVDNTGTIVCDGVYDSIDDRTFENLYVATKNVNDKKYVCLISKDGTKSVEIPFEKIFCSSSFVYVINSKTNTLQIYDSNADLITESAVLSDIPETSYLQGAYLLDYYNGTIKNLLTGNDVDCELGAWNPAGYFDDLIMNTGDSFVVYDSSTGFLCEPGIYEYIEVSKDGFYLCTRIDNGKCDLMSISSEVINLDYSWGMFWDDKLFLKPNYYSDETYICNTNGEGMILCDSDNLSENNIYNVIKCGKDGFVYRSYEEIYDNNNPSSLHYVYTYTYYDYEMNEINSINIDDYVYDSTYDPLSDSFYFITDDRKLVNIVSGEEYVLPDGISNEVGIGEVYGDYILLSEYNYVSNSKTYLIDLNGNLLFSYSSCCIGEDDT